MRVLLIAGTGRMPRNIRDRREPNRMVVHVTNRVWEGLPFVPNLSMRYMIEGILARAQNLYQIEICVYLFMANHYHMVLAGGGNRLSAFMNYVDGEIAKRMKRWFPERWGPKFWQGRYKEQLLATPQDVVNKIIYICCNPLTANLVSDIAQYPGANSCVSVNSTDYKTARLCSFTLPRYFKPIGSNYVSKRQDVALLKQLHKRQSGFLELKTDLFAWVKCFREEISIPNTVDFIKQAIGTAENEACFRGVIGAKRLRAQPFDKQHRPVKDKRDRTPFIECCNRELRKLLIASYRHFRQLCHQAWQAVCRGFHAQWPRGAFVPPRRWRLLNPAPA